MDAVPGAGRPLLFRPALSTPRPRFCWTPGDVSGPSPAGRALQNLLGASLLGRTGRALLVAGLVRSRNGLPAEVRGPSWPPRADTDAQGPRPAPRFLLTAPAVVPPHTGPELCLLELVISL